jgi:hypothetical protein
MPILPVLLLAAAQARVQISVVVRSANSEQEAVLSKYGRKAQATAEAAYPKILKLLDTTGRGTTIIQIIVANDLQPHDGKIAWTNTSWDPNTVRGDICIPAQSANPDDLGMVVHELMHVVQVGYRDCPNWLVEGIADYVRYYWFDPISRRPRPGAGSNCTDGYGTTAAFLDWTAHRYAPNLLRNLDQGFRSGVSAEAIFRSATRKTIDQLNTEWKRTLR